MPMARRNIADTLVPITPPILWNASSLLCMTAAVRRDSDGSKDDDGGVAEGKEEAYRVRRFAFLHQLANDIVDGGDMVGVEGMPKPEHISQERRPEQDRPVSESVERPTPSRDIRRYKEAIGYCSLGFEL